MLAALDGLSSSLTALIFTPIDSEAPVEHQNVDRPDEAFARLVQIAKQEKRSQADAIKAAEEDSIVADAMKAAKEEDTMFSMKNHKDYTDVNEATRLYAHEKTRLHALKAFEALKNEVNKNDDLCFDAVDYAIQNE